MKTSLKQTLVNGTMLAAVAFALGACGGKTNPTEEYSDLPAVPPHNVKAEQQSTFPTVFPRPDDGNILFNFTEGKENKYVLKTVLLNYKGVPYTLRAKNLPDWARLEQGQNGEFFVTGTPPFGTLATNEPYRPIQFQVSLEIPNPTDDILRNVNGKTYGFILTLHPTNDVPMLTLVKPASDRVVQGDSVSIRIEAKIPGGSKAKSPKLIVFDEEGGAQDAGIVQVAGAVTRTGKSLNGDTLSYELRLDTSNVKVPSNKNEVIARFVVLAYASGRESASKTVDVKVEKKKEASNGGKK